MPTIFPAISYGRLPKTFGGIIRRKRKSKKKFSSTMLLHGKRLLRPTATHRGRRRSGHSLCHFLCGGGRLRRLPPAFFVSQWSKSASSGQHFPTVALRQLPACKRVCRRMDGGGGSGRAVCDLPF